MAKKVEVKEIVRSTHNPFSNNRVVEIYDSEGNSGKGVGKTDEAARQNAQNAYRTASQSKKE